MIVGQNSSGKSNIIKIYEVIRSILGGVSFENSNYHNGLTNSLLKIALEAELSDEDIHFLIGKMGVDKSLQDDFLKMFGRTLSITTSSTDPNKISIQLGRMWIFDGGYISIYEKTETPETSAETTWSNLIGEYQKGKGKFTLSEQVQKFFENNKDKHESIKIQMDLSTNLIGILTDSIGYKYHIFSRIQRKA